MADGEGARAERARHRRTMTVALSVAGATILVGAGVTIARIATGTPLGHIPPAAGIAAAVLLPLLMLGGFRASWKSADELDRLDTLKACAAGYYAFTALSLAWIFLAQGDLVPKPNVIGLFLGTNLAFFVSYIRSKWQRR